MNNLTLVLFQYEPVHTNLAAVYLPYGLKKKNINFKLKLYPLYNSKSHKREKVIDTNRLYRFLADSGKILAVGCWSDVLPYLIVALRRIKKRFPEKVIILGGVAATVAAEEIMKAFPFIDFIVKGCGVEPLPKLIKEIEKGANDFANINGLVYRSNQRIISNPYAGFYSQTLTNVTLSYRSLEKVNHYTLFYMLTSYGCPYGCTYCQLPPLCNRRVVYKDLDTVVKEIKSIKNIKENKEFYVHIIDEGFVVNKKRAIEFFKLIKVQKLNINFVCYGRIDCMDEELLKIMADAGVKAIYYGIESGSDRVLKKIRKGFTVADAKRILLLTRKYIKSVFTSFICLYPFEKLSDFKATAALIRYLYSMGIQAQLHPLDPVKDSEIYRKYRKKMSLLPTMVSTSRASIVDMPRECVKIIDKYPNIFPNYYVYRFKGFIEILRQTYKEFPGGWQHLDPKIESF